MHIDAHQHFWQLAREDYGWLTPSSEPIYRDFMPEDLAPLLREHGIDRTIIVQAAPTEEETLFLLEIAARTPFVAGVVGWIDFEAPDATERVALLADDALLVGLRPMVQDIADDDWLLRPEFADVFEAIAESGLVFDALTLPRHLPRLLRVVEWHPRLRVVIDHLSKPEIRNGPGGLPAWRRDLEALARHPQVHCKLSGMITEAAAQWTTADLVPYAAAVLEAFGPQRVLWGSDWPVANLAGGYGRWRAATLELLAGLDDAARDAVLGGTAERVYLSRRR